MAFTNEKQMPVRDFLRSVKYEAMKLFRVFDAQNRIVTQYDAYTGAKDGDGCMRTDYVYDSDTNRIVKTRETSAAWQSSWDV